MTQRGKVTYYDAHKGQYCDRHFVAMTVLCVAILGNMTQPWRTIPGGQEVRLTNDKCIRTYMYANSDSYKYITRLLVFIEGLQI